MSGISTVTKIRYNPRGTYASNVRYGVDDMVFYLGSYYRCVVEGTTGVEPTIRDTDNTPWQKMSQTPFHEGEWNSSTTYFSGDVVGVTTTLPYNRVYDYQDYDTFICLSNTGVSGNTQYPPFSANWKKISSGNFNKKRAFLSHVNEGYVAPLRALWDARCGARPGGVGIVTLTNGGSGYTTTRGYPAGLSTAVVTISNGGGGTGFGASAVAYVNASGAISRIEITNPGFGYTSAPLITISGGGGSNATATAFSYQRKVGVGDTVGSFKNAGAHTDYTSGFRYINRRYGYMQCGYDDVTNCTMGWSAEATYNGLHAEAPFIHLDWLEGLLPTPDGEPPKVIQVECSHFASNLVLFNNGEVHYAGYNAHGQSGDATTTVNTQFVRCGYANTNKSGNSVLRGKKAIRIASTAGSGHNESAAANYALIENPDGTRELWSWGYNGYGQLANGNTTNQSRPVQVSLPEATHGKIVQIWATGGAYGNLWVLTDTGKLFAAGYNGYGQLGDGTATSKSVLTPVGIASTSYTWSAPGSGIKKFIVHGGPNAPAYCILLDNGELWNWGYNANNHNGQNHASNIYRPVRINTNGYTGVTAVMTFANVSAATTSGIAFSLANENPVYDVWSKGVSVNNGSLYISVGSTTNPGLTTALSTGENAERGLLDNTNTSRTVFVGMQTSNAYQLKNLVDVQTSMPATYGYGHGTLKCLHDNGSEHYMLPYTAGRLGTGEGGNYTADLRIQDPEYILSNYRGRPVFSWPFGVDKNYVKFSPIRGISAGDGGMVLIDLRNGRLYFSVNMNHANQGANNYGYRYGWQPFSHH